MSTSRRRREITSLSSPQIRDILPKQKKNVFGCDACASHRRECTLSLWRTKPNLGWSIESILATFSPKSMSMAHLRVVSFYIRTFWSLCRRATKESTDEAVDRAHKSIDRCQDIDGFEHFWRISNSALFLSLSLSCFVVVGWTIWMWTNIRRCWNEMAKAQEIKRWR